VQEILCPLCGTPTPDIRQGREMEIVALEIES
jgi:Zn finger protein HypA/HybF involved in hydrogenase expression